MTAIHELTLDVLKVVDLAVGDELDRSVLVGEGLLSSRQIDDRQPPHGQPDAREHDTPLLIGSSMIQRPHHALDLADRDRTLCVTLDYSDYSAHLYVGLRLSRITRAGTPAAM